MSISYLSLSFLWYVEDISYSVLYIYTSIYLSLSYLFIIIIIIYIYMGVVVFFTITIVTIIVFAIITTYLYLKKKKRHLDPSNWIHWTTFLPEKDRQLHHLLLGNGATFVFIQLPGAIRAADAADVFYTSARSCDISWYHWAITTTSTKWIYHNYHMLSGDIHEFWASASLKRH